MSAGWAGTVASPLFSCLSSSGIEFIGKVLLHRFETKLHSGAEKVLKTFYQAQSKSCAVTAFCSLLRLSCPSPLVLSGLCILPTKLDATCYKTIIAGVESSDAVWLCSNCCYLALENVDCA